MLNKNRVDQIRKQGRHIDTAKTGDSDLGPLQLLPGTWKNESNLVGRGWNMIALPFATPGLNYRLLVNQYNEELNFFLVDKGVPNRGISRNGATIDTDQFVVALDYEQVIDQIAADDFPKSDKAGNPGLAIHHEPGLWLHMTNETTEDLDIARLGTIPHGNSMLALGRSRVIDGPPDIPSVNGLPIGVDQDLESPYLAPYKHFHENLFEGLFDPVDPTALLKEANKDVEIVRTTELVVDTAIETGGVVNIPFIEKQADAVSMKSTFWIQELAGKGKGGEPKLRLQYAQVVMLDFFPRADGLPGLIGWPHVSINTMEKVAEPSEDRKKVPKPFKK
jgi:hypothetical protein